MHDRILNKDDKSLVATRENNSQTPNDLFMSFKDYKIDYNRCLGAGTFGTVYRVLPRPENEKGILSSTFPYIYDYFYRINKSKNEEEKKYCIKIYKSVIRIYWENRNSYIPATYYVSQSYSEPSSELQSNSILRKHGISNIVFFKPHNYYSQFKTRVRGKTFEYCLNNNYFIDPNQFMLRKSFIMLLNSLSKTNLCLIDVHKKNLMYDTHTMRWEIIDGKIIEQNDNEEFDPSWLSYLLPIDTKESIRELFCKLYGFSKNNQRYDQKKDLKILRGLGFIESISPKGFVPKLTHEINYNLKQVP